MKRLVTLAASLAFLAAPALANDEQTTGAAVANLTIGKSQCSFELAEPGLKLMVLADKLPATADVKLGMLSAIEVFKRSVDVLGKDGACSFLRSNYSRAFR